MLSLQAMSFRKIFSRLQARKNLSGIPFVFLAGRCVFALAFLMNVVPFSVPAIATPAQTPAPQPAIAMDGAPKEPAGFTHFPYANPDAPKTGTLKLGWLGTFDSLNPFIIRGVPAMGLGEGYLYQSLMARSWDEPFTLYGLIAQSIEVPEDRSSVIFNINPKARWSDGKPITAGDVLFSWRTLRDHGMPAHRIYYSKVAKAEKLGPLQVEFIFKPNPDGSIDRELPLIMGLMPILPQHIWQGRDFEKTTLRIPIGSGPYKLAKVDPGREVIYKLDPHYWGRDLPSQKGLFNFATIRIDYYRDDSIALEAFKAGQFDLRRENSPNKWATGYDFPAAHDGRVKLERFPNHRPAQVNGFILNTRRPLFQSPVLREALGYAFDSGWINRELFHGQYHRTESFFPNSELAAPPLPSGEELKILDQFRAQLPPAIFTTPVAPPHTDGADSSIRANLLKATAMLKQAGYKLRGNQLYAPNNQPVQFDVLLNDPSQEKVALDWARDLARLGIAAHVRTVDSAQYQERLATFDYDVVIGKWINSLSPGNEQSLYWSSAAANEKGSRNYAGVRDPVVDALATMIPAARTRADLVASTHALDRVLMEGHYVIPFFYLGTDDVAYWTAHLRHPSDIPLYGFVLESWWYK